VGAVLGALLAGGGAFATMNWGVGLNSGSSGQGESAGVSNLTISAVASPAPSNLLYPGGNGDVVLTVANPNPYPVTLTALDLPTNATYASGFTSSTLGTAQPGCSSSTSDVYWNYSTSTAGSTHTLGTALVVAASGQANNPLTVTLTDDASMTISAPSACEASYFSMPSLTGVVAAAGGSPTTTSPTVDSWTS
jgi:hypothetical protein